MLYEVITLLSAIQGLGGSPEGSPGSRSLPGPTPAAAVHDGSARELVVSTAFVESAEIRVDVGGVATVRPGLHADVERRVVFV